MKTLLLLTSLVVVAASAEIDFDGTGQNENELRYIVFPGLDAAADEIAEWATGWASPFNVYFGPKPYVVGWIGEGGPFGPEDPEIGLSEEDPEDEDDDDFEDPEDFYPETKNG